MKLKSAQTKPSPQQETRRHKEGLRIIHISAPNNASRFHQVNALLLGNCQRPSSTPEDKLFSRLRDVTEVLRQHVSRDEEEKIRAIVQDELRKSYG